MLTTTLTLAADYHLVQTRILDGGSAGKNPPTVFVLVTPNGTLPEVFQTFDSSQMEARLGSLPRGSIVDYDTDGSLEISEMVSSAQLESLKAYCQKHGVSLGESPVY
jgi:hypothetical protein